MTQGVRLAVLFLFRSLASRVSMLDPVRLAFKEYIRKTGTALVLDEEKVL